MENTCQNTRSEILACYFSGFMKACSCLLLLVSIQTVSANELIASHGDWSVSYGGERKTLVTVTLNTDRMVFGFVCTLSKQQDCTIGAHLSAQCDDNTNVSATILIDGAPLTDWDANCESAENPKTGQSDRVLLTSKLTGENVDALLAAMRKGQRASVTVETSSNKTLQSQFSLAGYSKAADEMFKVLGWESGSSNGIGGDNEKNSTAKQDLEKKRWTF